MRRLAQSTHLAFAFRARVAGHQLPVLKELLVTTATVLAFRMAFAVDQTETGLALALVAAWHVHAVRVRSALVESIVFAFVDVCFGRARRKRDQGKAFITVRREQSAFRISIPKEDKKRIPNMNDHSIDPVTAVFELRSARKTQNQLEPSG